MNKQIPIETKYIVETIKSFLAVNEGDDATEELLINVGAEILDMSPDLFMEEYLQKEEMHTFSEMVRRSEHAE